MDGYAATDVLGALPEYHYLNDTTLDNLGFYCDLSAESLIYASFHHVHCDCYST